MSGTVNVSDRLDLEPTDTGVTISAVAPVPVELIADILHAWQQLDRATGLLGMIGPLEELSNKVSDLGSYHPGFDSETGTYPWDREDEA